MQRNEILKAIIEGKQIQRQDSRWKDTPWEDMVIGTDSNVVIRISTEYYNYRIKPETRTLTYRVALFRSSWNGTYYTETYDEDDEEEYEHAEGHQDFIRWLTDEQTVEI